MVPDDTLTREGRTLLALVLPERESITIAHDLFIACDHGQTTLASDSPSDADKVPRSITLEVDESAIRVQVLRHLVVLVVHWSESHDVTSA